MMSPQQRLKTCFLGRRDGSQGDLAKIQAQNLGLHQVLQVIGLEGWRPLVVGAAAAAMTTSAFYSAMPVALVGASVWIMGGTTAAALDASTKGAIDVVVAQIPSGSPGGMLGGAVTGVLLELIGVHPGDFRQRS